MIELLQSSSNTFNVIAGILGLMVGSFLNVVIHRLPLMMEYEWRSQCAVLLEHLPRELPETFNLMTPRSRCPNCAHQISALENIPIFSYIILKGRCRYCDMPISFRYPLTELVSSATAVVVAVHFGFSAAALSAFVLSWGLISLCGIDIETQLLPDTIVIPMLWAGIVVNYFNVFVSLEEAVFGAVFGYLSLWTVFWIFKLATGKDGMGYGDFKLLALLGAWLGWEILPIVIVLSSIVGAGVGIGLILFFSHDKSKPIPFGPYLAVAGWIALLWGDEITAQYLYSVGHL